MLAVFLRPTRSCSHGSSPVSMTGARSAGVLCATVGWIVGRSFVQLAIEGRAADLQAAGDLGHLSAIMRDGKADDLVFQLLQRPQFTAAVQHRERPMRGQRRNRYLRAR